MLYAQFFNNGREILAMDSYMPIDGRLSLENAIIQARKAAGYKKEVKHITSFQLRKGTLTRYRNVSNVIMHNNRGEN